MSRRTVQGWSQAAGGRLVNMGVTRVSGERRTVRSGCKLHKGNLTCVLLGRRRGSFGPSRDTIFNECGVFASGRHRPSQVAGAPRRLPFHPTRPGRLRVFHPLHVPDTRPQIGPTYSAATIGRRYVHQGTRCLCLFTLRLAGSSRTSSRLYT
jgi:hypothetical protein